VATLRSQAARDPYDRALSDLVGELSTRSTTPVVGELELSHVMELSADTGLRLAIFTAEP
jgi:hypothetical protein